MLRGRGGCYKHTFYGIESHRCMETTPSLACANKCVFCWRYICMYWLRWLQVRLQEGRSRTAARPGKSFRQAARDGAAVKALASHQCCPGSYPGVDAICWLSLLLVFSFAARGFSPGTPVFLSPQKPTFLNSTRNQVDQEPLCRCATSKSLFIFLLFYLDA